jgi:hypothetical protein
MSESPGKDLGSPPDFYPCDSCGHLIPAERAHADMESLTLLCPECLGRKLRPCELCGAKIHAAAHQHLPTGRVICEPCVVKRGTES